MKKTTELQPISPTSSKPLLPWAISAASAIFIFLIMGAGSQYLARFQKPYNLNAQSEITVEIIDAPIVLDTQAKPDYGTKPDVSIPPVGVAVPVRKSRNLLCLPPRR